jgi:cell division protein FtsL
MAQSADIRSRKRTELPRTSAQDEAPAQATRYIYNGDPPPRFPGYAMRPNKRAIRRKVSVFNIILFLFGIATAIVLYIGNFITVNQLAIEVGQLQTRYAKIQNTNETLRAEIHRKSSLERIGGIAAKGLGLQYPKEQPIWIEIDQDELEHVKPD